jgi:3-hydroxyisobutyrate dehydrogenase-like beta-hydroxyacid dehydrogenase
MVAEVRTTVAVLGMGKMGQALARRLVEQEWPTLIWNRSSKDVSALESLGAVLLDSLDDLWERADVAITFLANDDALVDVCLGTHGIVGHGSAHHLLIDMSTVSPLVSRSIADAATSAGMAYLRSPVSGNPVVLASGAIVLLVSGPRATFDQAEDLLRSIGPKILYVGDAEQSRTLKLAINAALAITTQTMAELIILGERNGIDRAALLNAVSESVVGSPFVRYKSPGLVSQDYSATFTTALLSKDLDLVLDLARDNGIELPAITLVSELTRDAVARGYGDVDFTALLPSLQSSLGISPDIDPAD